MIAITKLKLDSKGRITFPKSFREANNIKAKSYVHVYPVLSDKIVGSIKNTIKLTFETEEEKWTT